MWPGWAVPGWCTVLMPQCMRVQNAAQTLVLAGIPQSLVDTLVVALAVVQAPPAGGTAEIYFLGVEGHPVEVQPDFLPILAD